jgi:hypothetical protein
MSSPAQNNTIPGAFSVALIEKPCYLYFVEYVPNQPMPSLPQGQHPAEFKFMQATNNTGAQNSTFQYSQ